MNYLIPHLPLNSPVNIGHHRQTPGTSAKALTTSASDGQLESLQPNGIPTQVTDANVTIVSASAPSVTEIRNPRPN
jgi:hypothetical protein